MIDVVTPAIVRPVIYERMLKSFRQFLFVNECEYRYIVNIDPFGEKACSVEDIANIARKYFSNVIVHITEKPSFASAIKYLWSSVQSDYFFYVEDDWELCRFVDMSRLIQLANETPNIGTICLRYYGEIAPYPNRPKTVADYEEMTCFSGFIPSLISKDFGHSAASCIIDESCPELQVIKYFLDSDFGKSKGYRYLRYGLLDGHQYLLDIGRKWKKEFRVSKIVDVGKPFVYKCLSPKVGVLNVVQTN